MSIIIDANRGGDFSSPLNAHAAEIVARINDKRMSIVIGGRLLIELYATPLKGLLVEWVRAGRAKRISDQSVNQEEETLTPLLSSNDPHVIALARLSDCRLLYTEDDALIRDFKNLSVIRPKGKIVRRNTKHNIACILFNNLGR